MTTQEELLKLIELENKRQMISACNEASTKVNEVYGQVRLNEKPGEADDNKFKLQEALTWEVYALLTKGKNQKIPIKGAYVQMTFSDGTEVILKTQGNGLAHFQPWILGRVKYEVPGIINNKGFFDVIE